MSTSVLLRRVGARAGLGLWRHRGGVLLALAASAALATYLAVRPLDDGSLAAGLGLGAQTTASQDCADTAMAAIANKSPNAAQAAYQCMDPTFQSRVPEQVFVQQIQQQALPNVNKVARVGAYQSPQGGSMVYFAVDGANGQSVGYIVYLGQDGRILKIE